MTSQAAGNRTILSRCVERQCENGSIPSVREAYDRLRAAGYGDAAIRDMCAQALAAEYCRMFDEKKPFNIERYQTGLRRLPVMPWEDDGSDYPCDITEADIREAVLDNPNLTIETTEDTLARYGRLRPTLNKIQHALLELGGSAAFRKCAQELGVMRANVVVADSKDALSVVADHSIYADPTQRLKLLLSYRKQRKKALDPEEEELLTAVQNARFRIMQCRSVNPGLGVNVVDVLDGQSFLVVDVNLSESVEPGFMFVANVVAPYGMHMTTGTPLPILDQKVGREIQRIIESYVGPKGSDPIDLSDDRGLFVTRTIRALLKHGAMEQVRYE